MRWSDKAVVSCAAAADSPRKTSPDMSIKGLNNMDAFMRNSFL